MKARTLTLLFLALLIACSPLTADTDPAEVMPDGQTLILWHAAEGDARRALLAQVDEFNASNVRGILVVPEYHGKTAQMLNSLGTAIDAGRTPELLLGSPFDMLRLGDVVVPFEDYVINPVHGMSDADLLDLYPAPIDANRDPMRNNDLISFPVAAEGTVLVYNIDRLSTLGYLTAPTSWALFREICFVATADSDGDRQPDVFGFGFTPRPDFVAAWFASRGASLLNPEGSEAAFRNENGLNMLQLFSELSEGGCFFSTPGARADIDAFSTGRVAMIFASTSDLRDVAEAVDNLGGFRWGVSPVPYGRRAATLDVSGPAWILLKSTPDKQLAAWFFVRWFASTEQTIAWAQVTGQLPLRRSARREFEKQSFANIHYISALELLENGLADPVVAHWPQVAEVVTRAVLAVVSGDDPVAVHTQAVNSVDALSVP